MSQAPHPQASFLFVAPHWISPRTHPYSESHWFMFKRAGDFSREERKLENFRTYSILFTVPSPELLMELFLDVWLPWWLSGKESACQCRRLRFDPWVRKIPWRRKWQPTPVFLPGKSYGQRTLAGHKEPFGVAKGQTPLRD